MRALLQLLVVAALSGCGAGLALPTEQDAERARVHYPDASLDGLLEGRSAYVAKCSGCHRLIAPAALDAAGWRGMVDDMRDRSHLTPDQEAAILRYLVVMSERAQIRT